jgi:hypothetical protein
VPTFEWAPLKWLCRYLDERSPTLKNFANDLVSAQTKL